MAEVLHPEKQSYAIAIIRVDGSGRSTQVDRLAPPRDRSTTARLLCLAEGGDFVADDATRPAEQMFESVIAAVEGRLPELLPSATTGSRSEDDGG